MGVTTQQQTTQQQPNGPVRSLADLRGLGKMTAGEATKERGGNTVAAFFEQNKAAIAAVLPKHMTPERMVKIALRCLRTTPTLMDCKLDSLFGATITAAQLGLEPNTPQGHIYLIPFRNGQKGTTEVQVVIGYKGLIDLARRSGQIVSISARIRYENDEWDMTFGTEEGIRHVPAEGERGAIRGFYAVAKLKDGGTQFEYMSLAEVERVRNDSQGYKAALAVAKKYNKPPKHPWVDHFEEMGRKTLIRRLCKYLPMSIELAHGVELDGAAEVGKAQGLASVLDGVDYTVQAEDAPEVEHDLETGEVRPDAPAAQAQSPEPAKVTHEATIAPLFSEQQKQAEPVQRGKAAQKPAEEDDGWPVPR